METTALRDVLENGCDPCNVPDAEKELRDIDTFLSEAKTLLSQINDSLIAQKDPNLQPIQTRVTRLLSFYSTKEG